MNPINTSILNPSSVEKRALRKRMRALRDAVPVEQRTAWSATICQRVIELPAYQSARFIHCYLTIMSEVDTRPLIAHALSHGKRVALPVFIKGSNDTPCSEIDALTAENYTLGSLGLSIPREQRPVALSMIDIFLTPLLAFMTQPTVSAHTDGTVSERQDAKAYRLGYGVAYYDNLLARTQAPKIGLAFEMQRVASLPVEPHDQLLDYVLTEVTS